MGLTGIVTEATLRLQPVETSRMVVDTERAADVDDCMARMLDDDDRLPILGRVDRLPRERAAASAARCSRRGNHARLDELPAAERADRVAASRRATLLRTPRWMPNGLLNSLSMRAFNELWFRKAPRERRDAIQTITEFFHPLDAVLDWNRDLRIAAASCSTSSSCPTAPKRVVRTVLERLERARCASFLAVLKRFEHDSVGPARRSRCRAGRSRSTSRPAGRGLGELLDGLDELVVEAGGRVYLTKDSRLRAELLPAMYPQLDRWREVRDALDPDHAAAQRHGPPPRPHRRAHAANRVA